MKQDKIYLDRRSSTWQEMNSILNRWLKERNELIFLLCSVTGLDQLHDKTTSLHSKLQNLCQVLVDYVSAGHFEVYEKLVQEGEVFGENHRSLIANVYPKLQHSTDIALQFHDRYESFMHQAELDSLTKDLGNLAELLELRFELEDQLIKELHTVHEVKLASAS
ncbi:MAG: sigma D regulator [Pseudomonadota bacterium]